MANQALDTFRCAPHFHNCAQAVANRWCRLYPEGQAIVDEFAPLKGGLAPGGMCGALYAATRALPGRVGEIETRFAAIVGATRCRDIKAMGKTPCQACVATADSIIEDMQK